MKNARLAASLLFTASLALTGCDDGSGTGGAGGAGTQATGQTGSTTSKGASTGAMTTGSGTASSGNASTSASTGAGADPFAAARQACIDKINELRATKSLTPYARWTSAESCVDQQATADEMSNTPHGAWSSGQFPSCKGSAQNECLGQGPQGIVGCLQSMWDERLQPNCTGCDACADAYTPNCPNCDFFGSNGNPPCGHYVNMSAKYLSEAACGFSALGGWDAINFK